MSYGWLNAYHFKAHRILAATTLAHLGGVVAQEGGRIGVRGEVCEVGTVLVQRSDALVETRQQFPLSLQAQ